MSKIVTPGKFENQSLAAVYLFGLANEGNCGETIKCNGGGTYVLLTGPFDVSDAYKWTNAADEHLDRDDLKEVTSAAGAILYESTGGFVGCTFYPDKSEYEAEVRELKSMFVYQESTQ